MVTLSTTTPRRPATSGRAMFILLALVSCGSGALCTNLRAQTPGAPVASFNPGAGAAITAQGDLAQVDVLLEQADKKILIGGNFDTYGGIPRGSIARLNADGGLDSSFNPGTGALVTGANGGYGYVTSMALQPNQDVVVGGDFNSFDGTATVGVVRLNPSGALDSSFVPAIPVDGSVEVIALQADGKILVAYSRESTGPDATYITRLNADGSLDTTFAAAVPFDNQINSMVASADGKILVGGFFTKALGAAHNFIVRLRSNGKLDKTFASKIASTDTTQYGSVYIMLEQPDGSIVVGGHFTSVGGEKRGSVARLKTDGSLDTTFEAGAGLEGYQSTTFAYSGALQPDGKVVIGGRFLTFDGVTRNRVLRLNADGTLDETFKPNAGADYSVDAVLLESDGDFLIGGYFTTYDGKVRHGVARIY